MYKKNCFAYVEKGKTKSCSALKVLDCEGCHFYCSMQDYLEKNKSQEVKNNINNGEF